MRKNDLSEWGDERICVERTKEKQRALAVGASASVQTIHIVERANEAFAFCGEASQ